MSATDNWTVDKLLKKVYSVHKQSLNGVTAELTECKRTVQSLEEKNKALKTQNEHLTIENKRLSTIEENKQASSGSCCEVIRQSLQLVITSYKELLENKDNRIKQLEDQLNKYKRRFSVNDSLNWTITDESETTILRRGMIMGSSPDSTSKLTPARKNGGQAAPVTTSPIPCNTDSGQNVTSRVSEGLKSPEESQKLRLQRRGKRSRYSEEVSPETKRPRHKADSATDDRMVGKQPDILVHDTCHPSQNSCVVSKNAKEGDVKRSNKFEDTVLVVPETLAVEDDCIFDDLDDEDIVSQNFGHKLSAIEEVSENAESELTKCLDKDGGKTKDCDEGSVNGEKLSERMTDRLGVKTPNKSPESNDSSVNDSLYEAISDIGVCVVDDSDHETLNLPNQLMSKPNDKVQLHTTDESHPLAGRCQSIDEVNELFETPEGKMNTGLKKSQDERLGNKKRLFKNSSSGVRFEEEAILRRSPRKRKEFFGSHGNKAESTSNMAQTKEIQQNVKRGSSGESDDNDLTVAPGLNDGNSYTENQSMDLYHIVPVKNGELVKSKQFQMKVKKNKYGLKSHDKERNQNLKHDLESPDVHLGVVSSLNGKKGSKVTEVITVSSPSVGSVSDPESPLLLKPNKTTECKNKNEIGAGQTKSSQSGSRAGRSDVSSGKVTRSRLNGSEINSKQGKKSESISKAMDDMDKLDESYSHRSNNLRQTTLTQRFFSPDKKQTKVFKSSRGEKCTSNKKIFQEMSKNEDEDIIVTGDSFSFKKPENPVGKETLSLKSRGRKQGKNPELAHFPVDLDETRQPGERDQHALHDVSSKHLNGSLDPAVELSMLCGEQATPENQPITSLPSLDTDFCIDDLETGQESLPKTSTLSTEDCEDIPSSYRFMPKKKQRKSPNKENIDISLDDSFDRPPKKPVDNVAHVAVVRKKDERQKLQGYGCKQCEEYYKSAGRSGEEVQKHMDQCSRHRAQYLPPDTPPHFWSVGFVDTQECVDRGYLKIEEKQDKTSEEGPTYRRRRRLNKYFKSKTEGSTSDSDDDLVYE